MSEQGNIRLKGAVRVAGTTGLVINTADGRPSNSGWIASVLRAGAGVYEYTVDPEWSLAFSDTIKVQCEGVLGAVGPFCSSVNRISAVRFDVTIFTIGAVSMAADATHSVRCTQINRQ